VNGETQSVSEEGMDVEVSTAWRERGRWVMNTEDSVRTSMRQSASRGIEKDSASGIDAPQ
jgi:hypothetical protein